MNVFLLHSDLVEIQAKLGLANLVLTLIFLHTKFIFFLSFLRKHFYFREVSDF
jgi:hypothetical protein